MRITSVKIKHYRTIENLELEFSGFYHALSGPNDSGKSNVIRAIGHVIGHPDPFDFHDRQPLRIANDFPKWITDDKDPEIKISVVLEIDARSDAGLYNFLQTYLKLDGPSNPLIVTVCAAVSKEKPSGAYLVSIGEHQYDGDTAQEVVKRLQTAPAMYFHNSTDHDSSYGLRRFYHGVMSEGAFRDNQVVKELNATVKNKMGKIAKVQQEKLSQILGRLEPRNKVSLAMPDIEMASIPYIINLESDKTDVPLNDWGSGTQNKTQILLALFNALASRDVENTAARVAPILVVEEPESFLHPSAQAQFGRLLQDLANELQIQIIAATHSPFMLSQKAPESNILVAREKHRKLLRATYQKETGGDNWMQPFGEALGIASAEFLPWKDALFSNSENILLVEGIVDREYFELLKDPGHGKHAFQFDGLIFAYDGCQNLKNQVVLKLVQAKFSNALVTFDLDAKGLLEDTMSRLNLKEGADYFPIGVNEAGKKCIEGLLPRAVLDTVYGKNSGLVQASINGTSDEKKSASNRLKRLLLDEFKNVATPGEEWYGAFYPLVKRLNTALKKSR